MTSRRALAGISLALALLAVPGCGDGTPAFCAPLADQADLGELGTALEQGDLDVAAAEARRLRDLADEAPEEIRSDFRELGDAVVDIVDLIAEDRRVTEATSSDPDAVNPSEVERRREDLNDRFGELDTRSERITTWARRECGLELS